MALWLSTSENQASKDHSKNTKIKPIETSQDLRFKGQEQDIMKMIRNVLLKKDRILPVMSEQKNNNLNPPILFQDFLLRFELYLITHNQK